jgi:hypothetical protein
MKCRLTHKKLSTEIANFLENLAVFEDFGTIFAHTHTHTHTHNSRV